MSTDELTGTESTGTDSDEQEAGAAAGLTDDDLLEMYRVMVLSRTLDERIWLLNRQGKAAIVASAQGHEAAQIGAVRATGPARAVKQLAWAWIGGAGLLDHAPLFAELVYGSANYGGPVSLPAEPRVMVDSGWLRELVITVGDRGARLTYPSELWRASVTTTAAQLAAEPVKVAAETFSALLKFFGLSEDVDDLVKAIEQ